MRAVKACSDPTCTHHEPCPKHERKPWQDSTRRDKLSTRSGSREQKVNRAVMRRDEGICHVCKQYGADEVDHVIPLSDGGADDWWNKAPIHREPCHRVKTAGEARRGRGGG